MNSPSPGDDRSAIVHLRALLTRCGPAAAGADLARAPVPTIAAALRSLPPTMILRFDEWSPDVRMHVRAAMAASHQPRGEVRSQFVEGTVGSLMRDPLGVVPEEVAAGQAVDLVRGTASPDLTYLYAVDEAARLTGVVVLRDLFLAPPEKRVSELMIHPPFFLTPEMTILDAMHAVVGRHFPVYPICRPDATLLGLVRGSTLFENQVIRISAQTGKLVGVQADQHTETSFIRSLRLRLPWLLVNLLLSSGSAVVMLLFRHTLSRFIILAVFLTVVATQGRNSGAQTMALVLRGMTAGTWQHRRRNAIVLKEVMLGASGGAVVGLLGGFAIWAEETWMGNPAAWLFGITVFVGMSLGCATSCAAGVAMPLVLRRFGFDPELAAGILLTNLCTVTCQTLFLALAVWWLV